MAQAEVIELGAHERMTVSETLGLVSRESPREIIVLFEDAAGNFILRSSAIDRKEALWLIERARDHILGRLE